MEVSWERKEDCILVTAKQSKRLFELNLLMLYDVHYDSPLCDRQMLDRHIKKAINEHDAYLILGGDWFDAMGLKFDKRLIREGIRPEDDYDDYTDKLLDNSMNYLSKVANKRVIAVGEGNHETNILRRTQRNLTRKLAESVGACYMNYFDFIVFSVVLGTSKKRSVMYHNHGIGKGAKISRNVLVTSHKHGTVVADIYSYGHVHMESNLSRPRTFVNHGFNVETVEPIHVHHGTYQTGYDRSEFVGRNGFDAPSAGGSLFTLSMNDAASDSLLPLRWRSQRAHLLFD